MTIKIRLLIFLLLVLPLLFQSRQVSARLLEGQENQAIERNSRAFRIETRKLDKQAEILAKYLARFDSPLQYHAQDFIDASNTYQLDWRLLPSIAGVESTFGKHIPGGFNAWGWGVYGTQAIYFNSWRDGIFTIAQGLRENYLNKGLTDPYSINRVYAASPYWAGGVSYFMQDLESFANQFKENQEQITRVGSAPNIAAVSGQLALR